MKKFLVMALITLMAPVMALAAEPAAAAGAQGGAAVAGGVSAGTLAAGTLAVAMVGATVLSNGGDGASSSVTVDEDVSRALDSLYATLSEAQQEELQVFFRLQARAQN